MDEEKDIYNLPIAAFTFGKNGQTLPYYPIQDIRDISKQNMNKNEIRINNISVESKGSKESNYSNEDSEKRFSFKNIFKKNTNNHSKNNSNNNNKIFNMNINNNFDNNNFVFIDKEDSNSSYLKIILYLISYMKLLNNYFLNELKLSNDQNNSNKVKLLLIIKDILIKIDQIRNIDKNINNSIHINNIINIEQLKEHLSGLYKAKKKFIKNYPDDPIDFLYIIINLLHSLKEKKEQKEASNLLCSDCFSHKNLWIKLLKMYECECKAQSKKILNKNNYFIDIPINLIINKFIKNNLFDMNQKLFIYFRQIITNTLINMECPKYGNECKINKVHYKYILKNCPSYLIFNLDINCFQNNELIYSLKDILKTFILIPHNLNINFFFEIDNNNNNNNYELIGIIFLKISKVYTCMFKQNNIFNYYDDNLFINFNNYYDIIMYSFKNGLIPISILYQNINKNSEINNIQTNNYDLTKDQILKLEKYIKNTNCLKKNFKNSIRTSENIISDDYIIDYNQCNNPSCSDNHNSSRYSGSINSFSSYQKNEYICNHCERINKIENAICFFCGYNNKSFLNNINNNIKKNLRKQKSHNINKNIIKKNVSSSHKSQNNELGEIEDEYKNIDPHVLKYFDMPRPYIPPPSNKNEKITSGKQSPKQNKSKIPISTNDNISNDNHINNDNNNNSNSNNNNNNKPLKKSITNHKINIINNNKELIKLNSPKYIFNNSESNTIENNLLNKLNPNNNLKRNINVIHKKRNSNSDNLFNNNYYSELNNNQLNINLKINNNNNYNIFEFSNKKNLINIEDYSGYGTEENNFSDQKLLKKINLIKNKKGNKLNINNNNSSNNLQNNNNYVNFKFINNNNISNSNNNLNEVNLGIYFQNNNNNKGNWVCQKCLNENNNVKMYCVNCKMKRNIIHKNKDNNFSNNNNEKKSLLNENKRKNK